MIEARDLCSNLSSVQIAHCLPSELASWENNNNGIQIKVEGWPTHYLKRFLMQ
jgi:hypothetical protein